MMPDLSLLKGPEHRPFTLHGDGDRAALLVHGFPGSPAEMRPLAEALHAAGWTVHAPLLPGFAAEIETLFERSHEDWTAAVRTALADLRRDHRRVLIGGHSMGAALALRVAAESAARGNGAAPDGAALSAPFWRLGSRTIELMWPALRLLGRSIKPFRLIKLDFNDPEMRDGIRQWMGDVDLDDPVVQQSIRDLEFPVGVFDEVRRAGSAAYRAAADLRLPTLVIQGLDDNLVTVPRTRDLIRRIPGPLRYLEVSGDHDLVNDSGPAWEEVRAAVVGFAASLDGREARPA